MANLRQNKATEKVLEERLSKHLEKAKIAAEQLAVLDERRAAREKSQQQSRDQKKIHRDIYTLGLVMKYVFLKRYKMPPVSKTWLEEAFPREKTERYTKCLEEYGIEVK